MSSIGETLRRERQKRNLDLDQISRELKISSRFLEAIEGDRFDRLPAGVFAKSFVRQYATLLGLDADELAAEVQRALTPEPPPGAPLSEPPKASLGTLPELHVGRGEEWQMVGDRHRWSSSLPALAMVVVVMLVCSGLYAFWQRARHPATPAAPPVVATVRPPEQPAVQPPAQAPVEQAPAVPAPVPAQQQPAAAPAPVPAQQQPAAAPAQKPAATQTQQAPPPTAVQAAAKENPAPAAAGEAAGHGPALPVPAEAADSANRVEPNGATPAGNPNAQVRLEITAAEPVWVLARANGKYLFSGTIEANQTKSLETNGTVLLRVGNAGGVSITLNGKPIGALGPKGQVRDVQFTSGGFQIVAAPKPPSLPPPGA